MSTTSPDSSVSNTEKPLFEIDLGQETGVFRPRSLDELSNWLDTERTFWSWVTSVSTNVPEIQRQLHNDGPLAQRLAEARASKDRSDETSYTRALDQIRNMLGERYGKLRLLHSSSPRAKYLASMPDKVAAGFALRYFLGYGFANTGNAADVRGMIAAVAFDLNLTPERFNFDTAAVRDAMQQISLEHENLRRQAGKLQDDFTATSTSIAKLFEGQHKQYDEAHASREASFKEQARQTSEALDSLKKESAEKLNTIAETYDKKLALQSAVTYLDDKAGRHRTSSIIAGIAALLAGAAFGWTAVHLGATLLAGDKPAWHNVAVAVLAATLCFWLLRILVRMFLSNLHLATDTRSRSTLMQTYLALLREGGGLKDGDRELILKMLFRPFSDGLVRDDATPPGIWDLATKITGGK